MALSYETHSPLTRISVSGVRHPNRCAIVVSIDHPASSTAAPVQCDVRGSDHTSERPPSRVALRQSARMPASHATHCDRPPLLRSHLAPMKAIPDGGSVTSASKAPPGSEATAGDASPSTTHHRASPRSTSAAVACALTASPRGCARRRARVASWRRGTRGTATGARGGGCCRRLRSRAPASTARIAMSAASRAPPRARKG